MLLVPPRALARTLLACYCVVAQGWTAKSLLRADMNACAAAQDARTALALVGSALDTAIFFTIAFSGALSVIEPSNDVSWANETLPLLGVGPVVPLWVSLGVADWLVKLALAVVALIPFRLIVSKALAQRAVA